METFIWIENTGLSIWVRETIWTFPTFLVLHALGMAFLAGTSFIINLRVLGFGSAIPLTSLTRFYPILIIAFCVNLVSGFLLLVGYPAKALTNPVFFLKMACVIGAMLITFKQRHWLNNNISTRQLRISAGFIIFLWFTTIVSGRLLAYTHTYLLIS